MNIRQLKRLGVPGGPTARLAVRLIGPALHRGVPKSELRHRIKAVVDDPAGHADDPNFGELAQALLERRDDRRRLRRVDEVVTRPAQARPPREQPAPYRQWGEDLDPVSVQQMETACRLPVAVRGALMPDAHVGYGLPIGGVLATRDAVIPYAVGVDIACRVKLSVLDLPADMIEQDPHRLIKAIEAETRFGIGSEFIGKRRTHPVLDDDWSVSPVTRQNKDKAHAQLGTSGSGNHFVEFGKFTIDERHAIELGLAGAGVYLALLSHSGSRGTGASVCEYYSHLAMRMHPELSREAIRLAWLDLDSQEGQEYWAAMNLMGRYASANHACIHRAIAQHLGAVVLADVENHHNFAWAEEHEGEALIVHRKGATPAAEGQLGFIPGSMASPGYLVRGKGVEASLNSAAHGAGRVMSRTQAKRQFHWSQIRPLLEERGVTLLSAGLDEVPMVYKNLDEVMSYQRDLVKKIARFDPKIVKMAPAGERPED
jgi:tRNA-splicing ligase RtcB